MFKIELKHSLKKLTVGVFKTYSAPPHWLRGKGRKDKRWQKRKWETERQKGKESGKEACNHQSITPGAQELLLPMTLIFPKWSVQSFEVRAVTVLVTACQTMLRGFKDKNNNSLNMRLVLGEFLGQNNSLSFSPSFLWSGVWLEDRHPGFVGWIFLYSYKYARALLWNVVPRRQFDSFHFVFKLC